jgi:eukaryotic-like serine/threonine-protein kinase
MAVEELRQALSNRYTIERELGRGGMATVYLATDSKVDRRVAVKVLHPELAAALGGERFHREIHIATRLTHPNILPVYDSGEANGTLFYVMPYVEGESLRDRLNRERQLGIDDAIRITCQIAAALDYAHQANIVHRDIKPENILIEAGQAVLADFGIARAVTGVADVEALTRTGMSLGTPAYMSPEQAMGERTLDGRSDQYSLACVAFEMLAGQPPFTASTMQALIARHIAEPVPLITTVRATVPDEVQDVILQALEKVPADRYATMGQFADALAEAGSMTMTGMTRRHTAARVARTTRARIAAKKPAGWSRKKQIVAAAAGVMLLAGTAAGATWMIEQRARSSVGGTNGLDSKRVAILYFTDDSPDRELGYLADALTESLIDELGRVRALDVVSKNGVAPFSRGEPNLDSVATVLQVGTIVRGRVEGASDSVRVQFELLDGDSKASLARGRVAHSLAQTSLAPRALAEGVADQLRRALGLEIRLRSERAGTSNTQAWLLVQRAARSAKEGEALLRGDSAVAGSQRIARADSLLAAAEGLDDRWSAPVIARAELAYRQARNTRDPLRCADLIGIGLDHAERALRLEPRNAAALEIRGTLRFYKRYRDLAPDPLEAATLLRTAEEDLRLATEIDPSRATAWNVLSMVFYHKYNRVEANLAARRAYEEDAYLGAAREVIWRLYATSYDLEQFPDAVQWCDLGAKRYPRDYQFAACKLWLMTPFGRKTDVDEAWRLLGELQQRVPPAAWDAHRGLYNMLVAIPIARAGLRDSAERVIARSRAGRDVDPRGELIGHEAIVRALIGDNEGSIKLITQYLTSHPEHREGLMRANTWWWRALQDDPRFRRLVGTGG